MSVPLTKELRKRLESYAESRQLKVATAARVLIDERLRELEDAVELSAAEEWQRAQAWATYERYKAGEVKVVSRQAVAELLQRKLRRRR